jgi:peptidoglycan/LPS O-acetylase OafA/YrhL
MRPREARDDTRMHTSELGADASSQGGRYQPAALVGRQVRIGTAFFWSLLAGLVLGLALLAVSIAYEGPGKWDLRDERNFQVNGQPNGVYLVEEDAHGRPFHWMRGESVIKLPLKRGGGVFSLQLQSGPVDPAAAARLSLSGGQSMQFPVPVAEPRVYQILVTPDMVIGDGLTMKLVAPAFDAPADARQLSTRLMGLRWNAFEPLAPLIRWLKVINVLLALALALCVIRDWPNRAAAFRAPPRPGGGQPVVRPRLDYIDGLRGLAVLMVVVSHTWIHTSQYDLGISRNAQPLGMAAIGVNLFMVISGFVLAYPLIDSSSFKPQRIGFFFQRRALRILPPYYVSIILFALAPYLAAAIYRLLHMEVATTFQPPTTASVATHMLFVHNMVNGFIPNLNGSYWSLELEIQFYLLFPLLIVLARRYGTLRMILGVLFVTLVWRVAVQQALPLTSSPSVRVGYTWSALGRLFEFALGIGGAVLVVRHPTWIRPNLSLLGALICLGIALYRVIPAGGQFAPTADIFIGMGFFLLVLASSRGWLHRVFTWRPLMWVGTISYSVYLVHDPLIREAYLWWPGLQGWSAFFWYTVVGTLALVAVGYLFFIAIERPSLRWGRRLAQRQATSASQMSEAHAAP